jgi:hypothetical protein
VIIVLKEELGQICKNVKQDAKELYEKVKQHPLIGIFFIIVICLLIVLPQSQVPPDKITKAT